MFVGVDAALSPAECNRKIARIFGENVKHPVGADASVRPWGNHVFAATFRKNGRASCRADRVVRPYGCVPFRIDAPTSATLYRAGGVEPRPYAGLVDSTRSPKAYAGLLLPTAQSFSRLRRQLPLHKGALRGRNLMVRRNAPQRKNIGLSQKGKARYFYTISAPAIRANRKNAARPSAVHLYTPASAKTCANTAPTSWRRISSMFSSVRVWRA